MSSNPDILELFEKPQPTREQRIAEIRSQLLELESALQKEQVDQQLGAKYKQVLETLLEVVEHPNASPQIMEVLQIFRETQDKTEQMWAAVQEIKYFLSKMSGLAELEREVLLRLQNVLQVYKESE